MFHSVAGSASPGFDEAAAEIPLHLIDQGSGPPMLLLPGWPFPNDVFQYLTPQLTQAGRRVVIPSLRGFGLSGGSADDVRYDLHADDLKGILERLQLDKVLLFGHSSGAAVALRYMSRHKGLRVSKLVLCSAAAPVWSHRSGYKTGLSLQAVDELIAGLSGDRSRVFTELIRVFRHASTPIGVDQAAWLHGLAMKAPTEALLQSLVEMRNGDLRPDLETVNVPTAIFHGVWDRFCPFAFADELAKGIKNSKVVRFENSGHLPFLEEPDKFRTELLKFSQGS